MFPATIFLIIGIDYTRKETLSISKMSFAFGLGFVGIYLVFQPNSFEIVLESGYQTIIWTGDFEIIGILMVLFPLALAFFWGLEILINSPQKLRKNSKIFFLGITLVSPINFLLYLFTYINPIFILFADITLCIGMVIITYIIIKDPKILYILPFKAYSIVVVHRPGGFPLFYHYWAEPNIDQDLFTCVLTAVEKMTTEVLLKGGMNGINLDDGVLKLEKGDKIIVGLLASKSSKFLRDCLIEFTEEFEKKFADQLNQTQLLMQSFDSAYELINRTFAYIPSRINEI
jgi:hypothetical protein